MAPAIDTRRELCKRLALLTLLRRRQVLRQQAQQCQRKDKRKRRWWVRPAWQKRKEQGVFYTLYSTLRSDDREMFFRFTRMSPERFDQLLSLVREDLIPKLDARRESISAEQKLLVTLRYLSSGDSQQSQSFHFQLGRSTVSKIIKQTCSALWKRLHRTYVKFPTTRDEWRQIATEYNDQWNLPHVLGSLDGKHIRMECPKYGGSMYYNYKNYHSMVLMAMCDANYRFIYVDIGHYGKDNDAGIFSQSDVYEMFDKQELPIPEPENLGAHAIPYYIIGDEIFPLKQWLMKPFGSRGLTTEQRVFNYRLSRARRTIENTFGILAARWRIFHGAIKADINTTDLIVKAAVAIHNYLMCTENARYVPAGFVDSDNQDGLIPGDWRSTVQNDQAPALVPVCRFAARNYAFDAKQMREHLCTYVNSEEGALEWQLQHVNSVGPTLNL